jgi:hypothetical protein
MDPISIASSTDLRRIPFKGTILVAHQVECMPWLGNISKPTLGDVYLLFDNAQYVKKHWQNKNKIRVKTAAGFQWLTIPVVEVNKHFLPTHEVRIVKNNWKSQHLKTIEFSYKKAPYFGEIFEDILKIYGLESDLLVDFLIPFIKYAFQKFMINIPIYRTSELIRQGYPIEGKKSNLIVNMCKTVNAEMFVFGIDGRTYIEKRTFYENNIKFVFQDFVHPVYKQVQGEFISHLSFLDLLFNYGPNSVQILGKSNYLEV